MFQLLLILLSIIKCEPFQWTWIGGTSEIWARGDELAIGQTSAASVPSGRKYSQGCYNKRLNKYYMFSGTAVIRTSDLSPVFNLGCDFWVLEFTTNNEPRWTRLWGTTDGGFCENFFSESYYVNRGQYSSNSFPAPRFVGLALCDTLNNRVIIQGGEDNHVLLDDLWFYDVNTSMFQWFKGNSPGLTVYSDSISARCSHAGVISNDIAEAWILGGIINGPSANSYYSAHDLYKLNLTSGAFENLDASIYPPYNRMQGRLGPDEEVVFLYGSFSALNSTNVVNSIYSLNLTSYTFKLISPLVSFKSNITRGSIVTPSVKLYSCFEYDSYRNLIFVFGGQISSTLAVYNDLWVYNVSSNMWDWASGNNFSNYLGEYGIKGISSNKNLPRARLGPLCFFHRQNFYVFGGGFDHDGLFNDLWKYELDNTPMNIVSSSTVSSTSATLRSKITSHNSEKSLVSISPIPLISTTYTNYVIYIIAGGGFIALCILVIAIRSFYSKIQRSSTQANDPLMPQTDHSASKSVSDTKLRTTMYTKSQVALALPGYLEFAPHSFALQQKLVQGSGGEIYVASALTHEAKIYGELICVKIFDSIIRSEKQIAAFEQEVSIMAILREEPHIVKLIGYCTGPLAILTKFYPDGSLSMFCKEARKDLMTKRNVCRILQDIASGISSLHKNDISHSDLKPQNVLVEINGNEVRAFLTDFGISHVLSDKVRLVKEFKVINLKGISVFYAAPEAFNRMKNKHFSSPQGFKAGDNFSFALISYQMLTKKVPWF